MSSECEKCGKHCLDCKCPIIILRKFISKEEAKKMFPDYGNVVDLNGPICKKCKNELIACVCL